MSGWKPKRFWQQASPAAAEGGFQILLDGRPVRTPAKTLLVLPSLALAEATAAEWNAQEGEVDPATMPFTRMANSAMDKVLPQKEAVAEMLAAYGGADLLCYRAAAPAGLAARQAQAWDPLLDWAAQALDAPLKVTTGIIHIDQPQASLAALTHRVQRFSPYEMAAFHDLVALSGSLILAFAVSEGFAPPQALWDISRIDEKWQEEQWGVDAEAAALATLKQADFLHAARFLDLSRRTG